MNDYSISLLKIKEKKDVSKQKLVLDTAWIILLENRELL